MSKNILVVAAHPDDEILGCGATIAKHRADGSSVNVLFVSDGETSRENHDIDDRRKTAAQALKTVGTNKIAFLNFPDNQLDTVPLLQIVQSIEGHLASIKPAIVYTHHFGDLNVDHAVVHQAVLTACRPLPNFPVKEIYAFEVLSSTEWSSVHPFLPNHFVNVSKTWSKKMEAISCYKNEMRKFPHARSIENIEALGTYRGASVGFEKAEAFEVIRSVA